MLLEREQTVLYKGANQCVGSITESQKIGTKVNGPVCDSLSQFVATFSYFHPLMKQILQNGTIIIINIILTLASCVTDV